MTLTHGDIQTKNGSHVYNVGGHPYIIDFGFSRYAPFYIDLVNYFTLAEAAYYREALADKGFYISQKDFEERFQIASKYPGFIYMFPGIMHWKRGDDTRLKTCLQKILQEG